jgi:hypothetical protein
MWDSRTGTEQSKKFFRNNLAKGVVSKTLTSSNARLGDLGWRAKMTKIYDDQAVETIFQLATSESTCPGYENTESLAEIRMAGWIEQGASNKQEFVKAGLSYLNAFPDAVYDALDGLQKEIEYAEHDENGKADRLKKQIPYIKELVKVADAVSPQSLTARLEKDWDERHEEDAA